MLDECGRSIDNAARTNKCNASISGGSGMDVVDFVKERFGTDHATKLVRIGTGGNSNKKGSDFENFYAASKICFLASSMPADQLTDFHVACQEVAFVDDLCVRQLSVGSKTNYQAKNSDGAPASWDEEMRNRFEMQYRIDQELHLSHVSTQVLLVSSEEKAAANDAKIPTEMKAYCASEHFPYHTSSLKLLMGHQPLREALNGLCGTQSLSNVDAAFRLVLGEWCADNENGRVVADVMGRAKANSRPDLFANFLVEKDPAMMGALTPDEIPGWLSNLLAAFQMQAASVECGAFIVSYNGMQARVAHDVVAPSQDDLAKLKSPGDIILFLMSVAAEGLDDQPSMGEIRK